MILTGKALGHFQEWYWNVWFNNKERDFYIIKEQALQSFEITDQIFRNALMIEFFDSVGIYIENTYAISFDNSIAFYSKVNMMCVSHGDKNQPINIFQNRNESTKQAIIHANQLYNEN